MLQRRASSRKYKVSKDGVIVLVRTKPASEPPADPTKAAEPDEKSQTLDIDTELEKARKGAGKLRNLDREVNAALMKLVRDKRKAYVMTGHGEINDPDSLSPALREQLPEARTTMIKSILRDQNYEVKDLGAMDGLVDAIPVDDATIVMVLAPSHRWCRGRVGDARPLPRSTAAGC